MAASDPRRSRAARPSRTAFSHPKSFLGLENEFTQRVDTVAFLPGLHACGTLTIVALDDIGPESPAGPSLAFADFDAWPRSNETREAGDGAAPRKTLMDLWDDAEDAVVESKALEGTVLAWSKGWRNTCGPGAVNKQVRVVAVGSKDLLGTNGMTREEYLRHLGQPRIVPVPSPSPPNADRRVTTWRCRCSYYSAPLSPRGPSAQQLGCRNPRFACDATTHVRRHESRTAVTPSRMEGRVPRPAQTRKGHRREDSGTLDRHGHPRGRRDRNRKPRQMGVVQISG